MNIVAYNSENSISDITKNYRDLVLEINALKKRKDSLKKEILDQGVIGDLFDVNISKN